MRSACLYLHYEEAEPEFTLKLPLSASPTVAEAIAQFSAAYTKRTGKELTVAAAAQRGQPLLTWALTHWPARV